MHPARVTNCNRLLRAACAATVISALSLRAASPEPPRANQPTRPSDASALALPGVVVHHSPQSSGLYIGSPSLAVLTNGDYVASHDFFGPKSGEFQSARTLVFRSADRGQTWRQASEIKGAFWSTLFVHRGALYLLGTDRHHGNAVIRRSTDGGANWTSPTNGASGLLRDDGEYHCAPVPVLEHRGRLWRGLERRHPPVAWGVNYRAGMVSVPVEADLLDAANWTFAEFLPSRREWNGGDMGAWLEGNAVVAPDGQVVNVLRVQTRSPDEQAALVRVSADGRSLSFDPETGFIKFPGGAKKFTIRLDPRGGRYWSLASIVHERHRAPNPGGIRNTLALVNSPDLTNWTTRCLLLYHPDTAKHGFQYVDWLFEGEDLIAVCRTAFDDGQGGARNHHDANFLTFHRWRNFRQLTMADSVPIPDPSQTRTQTTKPEWVAVAADGKSFELRPAGRSFSPRGFNYDHDEQGRLLEDYWEGEWPKVAADFQEMKALGANVVRVHLQFGRFMQAPDQPNPASLRQLSKLVALAGRTGLYLNLTGLDCYHKQDVPAWYDALGEEQRWEAQAAFWEAVARACADDPAVFCYDLMNEPVVAGAPRPAGDWLGPPFAGKHFVQFITRDAAGRSPPDVARQWIRTLSAAIRKHDRRHLITVGLVDWSLDRPGLRSGFVPDKIVGELDFLSVHLYPEKGKTAEALETLRGFAVGKPVVIEETFPLKCSLEEFEGFIRGSRAVASGWLGFYWGKTPAELRASQDIGDALLLGWLEFFQRELASGL